MPNDDELPVGESVMLQQDEGPAETYDEKNKRELLEKESTPFWLTNFFVKRPCVCLILIYGFLIYLTRVAFTNDMFSLADTNGRDFLVWSDPKVKDDDMRNIAREYITDNEDVVVGDDEEDEEVAIRSKTDGRWSMTYIF